MYWDIASEVKYYTKALLPGAALLKVDILVYTEFGYVFESVTGHLLKT
jgi:hypothetical protein